MKKWIVYAITLVATLVAVLTMNPKPDVYGKEGFWRIENDSGVWWFVSPDGEREFLNTVQTVQPHQLSKEPNGPHYKSKDYIKDDISTWAYFTAQRVRDVGFKGLGAWCHPSMQPFLPYARDLNLIKWAAAPITDDQWESQIEAAVIAQVPQLKNDKNLVGYYIDNELHWDETLIANAERYFEVTTRLIKKYDPNHLIMGVRFAGSAPIEVVKASKKYTDAQSINVYPSDARLDEQIISMIHEESGQPVIITEFGFHSLDGRSGNKNNCGFSAQVANQKARADAYRMFVSRTASVPYIIGADWFQWSDEPPHGRAADGEDVNFGIVDIYDEPYELLVNEIKSLTPQLNEMHRVGDISNTWRKSNVRSTTMDVHKVSTIVDGDISEWTQEHLVQNIRMSDTIGVTSVAVPKVYIGWSDAGLHVAAEVHDDEIELAEIDRWWTKDSLEVFVNTQPTGQTTYDKYCHQFFYIPTGIAGQWHRPGDNLSSHLIPHPLLKAATRRIEHGYIAEMTIPKEAINGWSEKMAFNVTIKNYHYSVDFFWSAGKLDNTHTNPTTWGQIVLK